PSPTRARAFAIAGSTSTARKARRSEVPPMHGKLNQFERRQQRVRRVLAGSRSGRSRLSIFRSSKHIYAQVIDDAKGETVASASSLEKDMRGSLKSGANIAAAKAVGKLVAERAAAKGVKDVVFDRGGYLYHGRIKALADAAREGGLNF